MFLKQSVWRNPDPVIVTSKISRTIFFPDPRLAGVPRGDLVVLNTYMCVYVSLSLSLSMHTYTYIYMEYIYIYIYGYLYMQHTCTHT